MRSNKDNAVFLFSTVKLKMIYACTQECLFVELMLYFELRQWPARTWLIHYYCLYIVVNYETMDKINWRETEFPTFKIEFPPTLFFILIFFSLKVKIFLECSEEKINWKINVNSLNLICHPNYIRNLKYFLLFF